MRQPGINPGELRHVATVQKRNAPVNDFADDYPDWIDHATIRGRLMPLRGDRLVHASQVHGTVTHEFTCRYYPDIDHSMRLVVNGRNLSIRGITDEEERNRWMIITCLEEKDGTPTG